MSAISSWEISVRAVAADGRADERGPFHGIGGRGGQLLSFGSQRWDGQAQREALERRHGIYHIDGDDGL